VSLPAEAGLLAMAAMNSPAFVAICIGVTECHRLGTTMVDTDWTEVNYLCHCSLLLFNLASSILSFHQTVNQKKKGVVFLQHPQKTPRERIGLSV
jgi:hypothetical protein